MVCKAVLIVGLYGVLSAFEQSEGQRIPGQGISGAGVYRSFGSSAFFRFGPVPKGDTCCHFWHREKESYHQSMTLLHSWIKWICCLQCLHSLWMDARGNTAHPWIARQNQTPASCSMHHFVFRSRPSLFLKFPGTINKQAMKDYRAALVTARVNYYPICAFLTALSEYHDIWLNWFDPKSLKFNHEGVLEVWGHDHLVCHGWSILSK